MQLNSVINSAGSAASPMSKVQGNPTQDGLARKAGLPCILVTGEAALAADLIKRSIFEALV